MPPNGSGVALGASANGRRAADPATGRALVSAPDSGSGPGGERHRREQRGPALPAAPTYLRMPIGAAGRPPRCMTCDSGRLAAARRSKDRQRCMISRMMRAVSLGVLPTRTPAASSATFFASAVPEEPEMMAPACPMVLPGGAVKPAM